MKWKKSARVLQHDNKIKTINSKCTLSDKCLNEMAERQRTTRIVALCEQVKRFSFSFSPGHPRTDFSTIWNGSYKAVSI